MLMLDPIPDLVQLGHGQGLHVLPCLHDGVLHLLKAVDELVGGVEQSLLGLDPQLAGQGRDGEEQISQLLLQILRISRFLKYVDAADDLCRFLYAGSFERSVCLLPVPGAPVFCAKPPYDFFQFIK